VHESASDFEQNFADKARFVLSKDKTLTPRRRRRRWAWWPDPQNALQATTAVRREVADYGESVSGQRFRSTVDNVSALALCGEVTVELSASQSGKHSLNSLTLDFEDATINIPQAFSEHSFTKDGNRFIFLKNYPPVRSY
jgi:hypothetical protein